jgi:hypothetical protein
MKITPEERKRFKKIYYLARREALSHGKYVADYNETFRRYCSARALRELGREHQAKSDNDLVVWAMRWLGDPPPSQSALAEQSPP